MSVTNQKVIGISTESYDKIKKIIDKRHADKGVKLNMSQITNEAINELFNKESVN